MFKGLINWYWQEVECEAGSKDSPLMNYWQGLRNEDDKCAHYCPNLDRHEQMGGLRGAWPKPFRMGFATTVFIAKLPPLQRPKIHVPSTYVKMEMKSKQDFFNMTPTCLPIHIPATLGQMSPHSPHHRNWDTHWWINQILHGIVDFWLLNSPWPQGRINTCSWGVRPSYLSP